MMGESNETYKHQLSRFDSINDIRESKKNIPFLADSDSMWTTNIVNIESLRKSQKIDNANNARNDNFNHDGVGNEIGTIGTRIKRSSDNIYSTGLSSGNNLKYGHTGRIAKRSKAV